MVGGKEEGPSRWAGGEVLFSSQCFFFLNLNVFVPHFLSCVCKLTKFHSETKNKQQQQQQKNASKISFCIFFCFHSVLSLVIACGLVILEIKTFSLNLIVLIYGESNNKRVCAVKKKNESLDKNG